MAKGDKTLDSDVAARDPRTTQRLMAADDLGPGIVHETRNMIAAVRGFAQVAKRKLAAGSSIEEQMSLLELIDTESARCVEALSSFLGFTRGDDKSVLTSINDVVRRSASLVRHRLQLGRVSLAFELGHQLPGVTVRPGEISQILVNLAINAQQAMTDGGVVHMTTWAADGHVIVAVGDNGPGVPVDARERIFEPWFSTKSSGESAGLGLAISARIAHENGGELALVDSDDGACFELRLPSSAAVATEVAKEP